MQWSPKQGKSFKHFDLGQSSILCSYVDDTGSYFVDSEGSFFSISGGSKSLAQRVFSKRSGIRRLPYLKFQEHFKQIVLLSIDDSTITFFSLTNGNLSLFSTYSHPHRSRPLTACIFDNSVLIFNGRKIFVHNLFFTTHHSIDLEIEDEEQNYYVYVGRDRQIIRRQEASAVDTISLKSKFYLPPKRRFLLFWDVSRRQLIFFRGEQHIFVPLESEFSFLTLWDDYLCLCDEDGLVHKCPLPIFCK
ncbi:hypothetical protein PCE1_001030 [Barthelona sp. PCE]